MKGGLKLFTYIYVIFIVLPLYSIAKLYLYILDWKSSSRKNNEDVIWWHFFISFVLCFLHSLTRETNFYFFIRIHVYFSLTLLACIFFIYFCSHLSRYHGWWWWWWETISASKKKASAHHPKNEKKLFIAIWRRIKDVENLNVIHLSYSFSWIHKM